jgi:hypothetical protein
MDTLKEPMVRVFAMYYGCELLAPSPFDNYELSKGYLTGIKAADLYQAEIQFHNGIHAAEEPAYEFLENCRLLLNPLSAITTEHAIEVMRMVKKYIPETTAIRYVKDFEEKPLAQLYYTFGLEEYITANFGRDVTIYNCPFHFNQITAVHQYLILQGYAVPLFFAPNHPDNGKTAVELGLAIDATLQPA